MCFMSERCGLGAVPLGIDEVHRKMRARIRAAFSSIMRSDPLFQIVGNAGIEAVISAFKDIHEPHEEIIEENVGCGAGNRTRPRRLCTSFLQFLGVSDYIFIQPCGGRSACSLYGFPLLQRIFPRYCPLYHWDFTEIADCNQKVTLLMAQNLEPPVQLYTTPRYFFKIHIYYSRLCQEGQKIDVMNIIGYNNSLMTGSPNTLSLSTSRTLSAYCRLYTGKAARLRQLKQK